MRIKELNSFRSLFGTQEPNLPVPIKNASMKDKIRTLSEDRVQFIPLILSTLFTNSFVDGWEGGNMNPTLKEIANAAASNGQNLFADIPHPSNHGRNIGCIKDPLLSLGKEKRTYNSKFLFKSEYGNLM